MHLVPKKDSEGQRIASIDVIEMWRLNHHLACAVKCLSRAGRGISEKADVEKAIWYLDRFMRAGLLVEDQSYMELPQHYGPLKVSINWHLGTDLSMALHHLFQSPLGNGITEVEKARSYLQNRVNHLERNGGDAE